MNISRYGQPPLPAQQQSLNANTIQKAEILDGGRSGRSSQDPSGSPIKPAGVQPLNSSGRGQFVNIIV